MSLKTIEKLKDKAMSSICIIYSYLCVCISTQQCNPLLDLLQYAIFIYKYVYDTHIRRKGEKKKYLKNRIKWLKKTYYTYFSFYFFHCLYQVSEWSNEINYTTNFSSSSLQDNGEVFSLMIIFFVHRFEHITYSLIRVMAYIYQYIYTHNGYIVLSARLIIQEYITR